MEDIIQSGKVSYSRLELFYAWQLSGTSVSDKRKELEATITRSFDDEVLKEHRHELISNVSRFCSQLVEKWEKCYRMKDRFLKKHEVWLKGEIVLFNQEENLEKPGSSGAGRPTLHFQDSSERSKRRKTKELIESTSPGKLSYAVRSELRAEGKHDAAKLLTEALEASPSRARKIRKAWEFSKTKKPTMISPEEAVSMIVETRLTKSQYIKIRLLNKEKRADIYPNYNNGGWKNLQCSNLH